MKKFVFLLMMFPIILLSQTMTDERDGKTYDIVEIDGQVWLGENLEYGLYLPLIQSQKSDTVVQYWCYQDTICENGGYYTWKEACNYGAETDICPDGWHIPTLSDIEYLRSKLGKSDQAFTAMIDPEGLNFSLSGYIDPMKVSLKYGYGGYMWVRDPANLNDLYVLCLIEGPVRSSIYLRKVIDARKQFEKIQKNFATNVRCVKDKPELSTITFEPMVENRYQHKGTTVNIEDFFGSSVTMLQYVIDVSDKNKMLWISWAGGRKTYKKMTLTQFEPNHEYIVFTTGLVIINL